MLERKVNNKLYYKKEQLEENILTEKELKS